MTGVCRAVFSANLPTPGNLLLDTRTKIRSPEAVVARPGMAAAKGWFDVLTADHCRALAAAAEKASKLLVLVVRESAERAAALPAADRAQLAAGLACVDEVVICDESEADDWIAEWRPSAVVDVEALVKRDVAADVLAGKRSG